MLYPQLDNTRLPADGHAGGCSRPSSPSEEGRRFPYGLLL